MIPLLAIYYITVVLYLIGVLKIKTTIKENSYLKFILPFYLWFKSK